MPTIPGATAGSYRIQLESGLYGFKIDHNEESNDLGIEQSGKQDDRVHTVGGESESDPIASFHVATHRYPNQERIPRLSFRTQRWNVPTTGESGG